MVELWTMFGFGFAAGFGVCYALLNKRMEIELTKQIARLDLIEHELMCEGAQSRRQKRSAVT